MKKYSFILIIASALLLEAMGAAQYFLASNVVDEVMARVQADVSESKEMAVAKAEVESAVRNFNLDMEESLASPDLYDDLVAEIVLANPRIAGAGVAFKPNYFEGKGRDGLFAPYCYDRAPDLTMKDKNTKKQVKRDLLSYNYINQEWFIRAFEDGQGYWTPPYTHKIEAGNIIMCTYAIPVRNKAGEPVGVFFAEMPMEKISQLSMELQQGVVRNRSILFIIQLLSLAVICVIVWMTVRAFRRYKEQVVDPEKEHMAAEIERLRTVNLRQTKRIQELINNNNKNY